MPHPSRAVGAGSLACACCSRHIGSRRFDPYRLLRQYMPVLGGRVLKSSENQYHIHELCRAHAGTCCMRCITPPAPSARQSAPAAGAHNTWRPRAAARTRAAVAAGPGTHRSAHARPRPAASGMPGPARQPRAALCQPCILPTSRACTEHGCSHTPLPSLADVPQELCCIKQISCCSALMNTRRGSGVTAQGRPHAEGPQGGAPCPCRCARRAP